jgi:2-polyprenyl-6-methoxyphenol hydroxylase-like FAD-dependent oxidoreductase
MSDMRRTVAHTGVEAQLGAEVTALDSDADSAQVKLADGRTTRARYLVGCHGVRSMTGKAIATGLRDTGCAALGWRCR